MVDAKRSGGERVVLAIAALSLGAVAMGASPIFVRLADMGPYASAFWRTAIALPFLLTWMCIEDRANRYAKPGVDWAVCMSGVFFAIDLLFWHLAILSTTVANATFLATTAPIWVAFGAWLRLSEAITARHLFGLALCLSGGPP